MKKILYILLVILYSSCEDVIEVEVPTAEPKLVVNAAIKLFPNNPEIFSELAITLSLSSPFFENKDTRVEGATVFITDLTTSEVFNYLEFGGPGNEGTYFPDFSSSNFVPRFDTEYELTIIYNEEVYKAVTSMQPSVPIDSVVKGNSSLFQGDEVEVIITITDNPDQDNYYLFDLDLNLFLPSEDRFFQGETFPFSYFYEMIEEDRELEIRLLGIDREHFNYMNLLLEQSGQNAGGPFQAPPATLRGNIVNTTNPDNIALGYFSISETFIEKFNLFE
ncbi:DUF4249 domain-containing protein [Aquimarina sp. ERC-38]|uniref:DUF4249 domain-containing protein n=1 Tax=Aquimarina sp. ERC-38 TaxID=2949996 RepID=UPI002245FEAE|nr:DUF4249 domain-containing protein [Aquimarina sp. ERC-38]UZO80527.1 DUF4249 domain-containing protein [Aquimarina sp. ERC-38]